MAQELPVTATSPNSTNSLITLLKRSKWVFA